MKLTHGEKWRVAAACLALAGMLLCFGTGQTAERPLANLPAAESAWAGAPAGDDLVDVNTAGPEELMTLPNIGPARAEAILAYRQANGPFRYPEDLIYVEGIGEGVLAGLLDKITAGGG